MDGKDFRYKVKGEGFPVVLLHGLIGNLDIMDNAAEFLASKGYRSIQVTYPTESFTLESYAKALVNLLDGLRVDKAAFFGTSMGGYTVQILARYFPQRVAALILANTFSNFGRFKLKSGFTMRLARFMPQGLLFAYFKREFSKVYSDQEVEVLMSFVRDVGKKGIVSRLNALLTAPDEVRFEKKFPVAVFSGKDDPTITDDVLKELIRATSPDFVYIFEKGRHFSYLFAPKEFNSVLLDFLEKFCKK